MPVIVVANPKGGVGKSTLSTNVAGYLAHTGHAVMLGDADRQQSARTWLSLRPEGVPKITGWDLAHDEIVRPPKGTTHVVLDTPAGLHGKRLDEVMKVADKVIVPLQPSIFDIHATHAFIRELLAHRRSDKVSLGVVGMRIAKTSGALAAAGFGRVTREFRRLWVSSCRRGDLRRALWPRSHRIPGRSVTNRSEISPGPHLAAG